MLMHPTIAMRLRSRSLDDSLIAGADPGVSTDLAARAARLTSSAMRREVADGLERLATSTPARRLTLVPFRRSVAVNATELRALAIRLRGPSAVRAPGIAILRRLLTDGTGPAYTDRTGESLAARLHDAREAIGT
jgi:hypothetical protein